MKTGIQSYQRVNNSANSRSVSVVLSFMKSILESNGLILLPAAFLLGRAPLIKGLMPFGMPLYAATYGLKVNRFAIAVSIILGMLTGGAREQIYIAIAGMVLFNAFNITFRKGRQKSDIRFALTGLGSVIIPELVIVYMQGLLLFDLLKALFHGFIVFTLMFIYRNFITIVDTQKKSYILTNEELISIAIVATLALSGLSGIRVFGFDIKNVMCILIILMFSYKCGSGVGAALGVTVGLVVSMSGKTTPFIIGSFAFCGLLSGIFRKIGKGGASLGFVLGNTVLTLYLNGSTEVLIHLKEILAAALIFIVMPQKFSDALTGAFYNGVDNFGDKRSYSQRIKDMTVGKLDRFSRAFKELSKTFGELSQTKVVTNKQDISSMFDRVADKVCKDCSLCLHCWDRSFYSTYQAMFRIVERLDMKGWVDEKDIPDYFMERCERLTEFVKEINNIYEIFKVDMVWKSRISESRTLVSQQLDGLSKVISNLAAEIKTDMIFKKDVEDLIQLQLHNAGIKTDDVIVFKNKWGKYEVEIFHRGCAGRRHCLTVIDKIVSHAVGCKMTKDGSECYQNPHNRQCSVRFVEEETFRVTTGIARIPKYDGMVSGDSYTFLNTGEGKYILALSDGMGSGRKAAAQSQATIGLLEQFMESGFDKDTTIKLINSILVLKSNDDSYSTIDLSVIDLYSGQVEFVKIGAVPSFIKREDRVECVKSISLPAGILNEIHMELIHKTVTDGAFIIMLSDGVLDTFVEDTSESDRNLRKFIQSIKSINPQEIADTILDEALMRSDGRSGDDMTVIVGKVWKRTS